MPKLKLNKINGEKNRRGNLNSSLLVQIEAHLICSLNNLDQMVLQLEVHIQEVVIRERIITQVYLQRGKIIRSTIDFQWLIKFKRLIER